MCTALLRRHPRSKGWRWLCPEPCSLKGQRSRCECLANASCCFGVSAWVLRGVKPAEHLQAQVAAIVKHVVNGCPVLKHGHLTPCCNTHLTPTARNHPRQKPSFCRCCGEAPCSIHMTCPLNWMLCPSATLTSEIRSWGSKLAGEEAGWARNCTEAARAVIQQCACHCRCLRPSRACLPTGECSVGTEIGAEEGPVLAHSLTMDLSIFIDALSLEMGLFGYGMALKLCLGRLHRAVAKLEALCCQRLGWSASALGTRPWSRLHIATPQDYVNIQNENFTISTQRAEAPLQLRS